MYKTRNSKKRMVMQDMSNFSPISTNSIKNSNVLQKIPLTEVTETLRPRRACKKRLIENSCKENVHQNKPLPNAKEYMKTENPILKSKSDYPNILQKIPLTQVTETLRPRRACKKQIRKNNHNNGDDKNNDNDDVALTTKPSAETGECAKSLKPGDSLEILRNLPHVPEKEAESSHGTLENNIVERDKEGTDVARNNHATKERDFPEFEKSSVMTSGGHLAEIMEKVILIEAAETLQLRPQRAFRIFSTKNNKGNDSPRSKINECPKNEKRLALSSGRIPKMSTKFPTVSEKSSLLQNFNLKNTKSDMNSSVGIKRKNRNKTVYQNNKVHKKRKVVGSAKENQILSKFPKWISNGVESLRQRKQKGLKLNVYDIETDQVLMLDKSLTQKVVKKARITKTKNYSAKSKNGGSQLPKNNAKSGVAKLPVKIGLDPRLGMSSKPTSAPTMQKKTGLNPEKVCHPLKEILPSNKAIPPITVTEQTIQNSLCIDVVEDSPILNTDSEKLPKKLKTYEKHHQKNTSLFAVLSNSFNFDLFPNPHVFPMPQSSSTPQMNGKQAFPVQMQRHGFDASSLEILPSGTKRAEFADCEFVSAEEITSESEEIQLEESELGVENKSPDKPSAVKNLNASLNVIDNKVTIRPIRACRQNKPLAEQPSDEELSFENDSNDLEATLFEYPEKTSQAKEEQKEYPPPKDLYSQLFPEECTEFEFSWSVVEPEESVLKPRLSYYSPGQIRRNVVKRKKNKLGIKEAIQGQAATKNEVPKNLAKQGQAVTKNDVPKKLTKQEQVMASLNSHFVDIEENFDLCID